ncbi:MAG TPA: trypsin-like peptidase domain-containing protein [Tepidisphaeraceae bacterium]|jgi:serine protease Do|nr:trypsin-like peptidase domain-containing protein [Tepidisphaeraceae bacterium]
MKGWRKTLTVMAIAGSSIAAYTVGTSLVKDVQFARAEEQVKASREQLAQVKDLADVFRAVGKAVEPSVVSIDVKKTVKGVSRTLPFDDDMLRRFFPDRDGDGEPDLPDGLRNPNDGGDDEGYEAMGTGSGVIMEVDGSTAYIVTNNHVAGGADSLKVTLSDGRVIDNGKVLGADPKTDLAVVKISADRLIPAKWGNSDELQKGDWIMAFGSPFGYVGSMTHGIVSALNRDVGILRASQGYEDFIQVDAPINPGNSGGPLVNVHGEVVGINTAIASRTGGFQGIGFAIPSNQAKRIYASLKENGKVVRGWLGVEIANVTDLKDDAKSLNYTGDQGVLVAGVMNDTPAGGKLKPDDIITKLDGNDVKNVQQLRSAIALTKPGQEVTMTVFRNGKTQDVKIKLGEQPENLAFASGGRNNPRKNSEKKGSDEVTAETLGLRLATPTEQQLQRFGLEANTEGALVTQVVPGSLATRRGIQVGDLITSINGAEVKNADDAQEALNKVDLKKGVRLHVTTKAGERSIFLSSAK